MLGVVLVVSGCFGRSSSTAPSLRRQLVTYNVRGGDTVYGIAQRYGVSVSDLMAANGIRSAHDLRVGETLVIPGQYSYAYLGPSAGQSGARRFSWPVDHGVLSSGFGMRDGAMHQGVDIAAPVGTPVHAAASGVVIFSGRLRGYGNVVIVRHDGHYVTVYGHDAVNLVREGEQVRRGQTIGEIGRTGRTTGANLHFEVRRDNVARNPLPYLPPPASTVGISFARNGGS